jgi:hypothetical protein
MGADASRRTSRARARAGPLVALERALDKARGRRVRVTREREGARTATTPVLEQRVKRLETALAAAHRPATTATTASGTTGVPSAALQAIAACESGGDPTANPGNGFYGKYQFTQSTWASIGGTGNPAAASEAEQDARAAQLYAQQGSAPWPVCGR